MVQRPWGGIVKKSLAHLWNEWQAGSSMMGSRLMAVNFDRKNISVHAQEDTLVRGLQEDVPPTSALNRVYNFSQVNPKQGFEVS